MRVGGLGLLRPRLNSGLFCDDSAADAQMRCCISESYLYLLPLPLHNQNRCPARILGDAINYACITQALELLRCLCISHWKELSAGMDESAALQRWSSIWVHPVLDQLTSDVATRAHKSRLSDVRICGLVVSVIFCRKSFAKKLVLNLLFNWLLTVVLYFSVVSCCCARGQL